MAVPADTFPQHPQSWTLEEVLALPEDEGQRVELIDGALVVSPGPGVPHQRVLVRVMTAFFDSTPDKYEALPGINAVLSSQRLLIPDLSVTMVPGLDAVYCKGADVLVAVEIISPSSRVYDRALKRQLYAEARIPYFMIVDPASEPPAAIVYALDGEEYRESAVSASGKLRMTEPFPMEIDLVGDPRG